jgi:hypothetical protein
MRDFLHTRAALEPEVIGFLTMWNYEEYFHGRALAELMEHCGAPLETARIASVRSGALLSERLEALASNFLSKVFSHQFPAVYMSWGAIQEITTLRGYERLIDDTKNPVLRELCERIAKQERRHFAWYFNSARKRLEASPGARNLTRILMENFWSPVGAGVKTPEEVNRLILTLFPGESALSMAEEVDQKMGTLPGLEGIALMVPFVIRARNWAATQGDSVKLLANPGSGGHTVPDPIIHVQQRKAGSTRA